MAGRGATTAGRDATAAGRGASGKRLRQETDESDESPGPSLQAARRRAAAEQARQERTRGMSGSSQLSGWQHWLLRIMVRLAAVRMRRGAMGQSVGLSTLGPRKALGFEIEGACEYVRTFSVVFVVSGDTLTCMQHCPTTCRAAPGTCKCLCTRYGGVYRETHPSALAPGPPHV